MNSQFLSFTEVEENIPDHGNYKLQVKIRSFMKNCKKIDNDYYLMPFSKLKINLHQLLWNLFIKTFWIRLFNYKLKTFHKNIRLKNTEFKAEKCKFYGISFKFSIIITIVIINIIFRIQLHSSDVNIAVIFI